MEHQNPDPQFRRLAAIAQTLGKEFISTKKQDWAASPFAWLQELASSEKGRAMTRLVAKWLEENSFSVGPSPDHDADLVVNGHRVEVKSSTLWKAGVYRFQQIRDQNYEFVLFFGISPRDASCWLLPKRILFGPQRLEGLTRQHGGRRGVDTRWLTVPVSAPPDYLNACGGPLSSALQVLRRALTP